MPATERRSSQPSTISAEAILGAIALGVLALLVGGSWSALHLANAVADQPQNLPANPFALVLALATGDASWTPGATAAAVTETLMLAAAASLIWWWRRRRAKDRSRVDVAATY